VKEINKTKLAAWAGMIGPVLFVIVFAIEGLLRPGYSPIRMYMSELSLGPCNWIQILNFIIFGILLLLFTRGSAAVFHKGKPSKAGPILFAIIGFSLLVSGSLATDPETIFSNQTSWHGTLHGIFGALVFSLAPVSCFVFFRRFREHPKWQLLKWWTFVAGLIFVIAIVFMKIGESPLNAINAWIGLIQRVALVTYLIWIFTFALVLYKKQARLVQNGKRE
jgi:hypothetical membrane protein